MFDGWESIAILIVAILGIYGVILWLGLVVWAYRDIRERTRDNWSQTVGVLLVAVLNIPGLLLYMLLRPHETLAEAYERRLETEAFRQEIVEQRRSCPTCQKPIQEEFLLCPHCRTNLREPCVVCSRPLELTWAVCPYCGAQGPRPAQVAAGPPVVEPSASAPRQPSSVPPPVPVEAARDIGSPTPSASNPRPSRRARSSPS